MSSLGKDTVYLKSSVRSEPDLENRDETRKVVGSLSDLREVEL